MNTRPTIESSAAPVALSIALSDDGSNFTVGLENGFSVFSTTECRLRSKRDLNGGLGHVVMLGKSNFIGVVGGGKNPRYSQSELYVWDDLKQKPAIRIPPLTSTIRGLKLTKSHIAITLLNSVRVYSFAQSPQLWGTFETTENPLGLCLLNESTVVFPGRTPGQLQLVELRTGNVSIIPAHSNPIRALALSQDGQILATASETGTLVRVYATNTCARIAELRRGVDTATIFSLAISPAGLQVAVTSDKSTLHIFDITHPNKPGHAPETSKQVRRSSLTNSSNSPTVAETDSSQKWGILGRLPMLPRVFSDVYSFASVHFEMGNEERPYSMADAAERRPVKGVVGWLNEYTVVVLGAGRDARWEKFIINEGEDGRRYCVREGWKRYLAID